MLAVWDTTNVVEVFNVGKFDVASSLDACKASPLLLSGAWKKPLPNEAVVFKLALMFPLEVMALNICNELEIVPASAVAVTLVKPLPSPLNFVPSTLPNEPVEVNEPLTFPPYWLSHHLQLWLQLHQYHLRLLKTF